MQPVLDLLPKSIADSLPNWFGYLLISVVALIIFSIAWSFLWRVLSRRKKPREKPPSSLLEDLTSYPPAPAGALNCRLLVDKNPVRLRLVVFAPIGDVNVNLDDADEILDRLSPRLGDVARQDKPRVKLWPRQVSASGFAQQFHNNVVTPEEDGEQSPWVLVAGRAKIGKRALMVGLAMQSKTPLPLERRTLDVHEWTALLQVRVKDG